MSYNFVNQCLSVRSLPNLNTSDHVKYYLPSCQEILNDSGALGLLQVTHWFCQPSHDPWGEHSLCHWVSNMFSIPKDYSFHRSHLILWFYYCITNPLLIDASTSFCQPGHSELRVMFIMNLGYIHSEMYNISFLILQMFLRRTFWK